MKLLRFTLFFVWALTPIWSQAQVDFTSSALPIVWIVTEGSTAIPDDPRILSDLKIINRGDGERNFLSDKNNDLFLDYNGKIQIEIRGSSSQNLLKKQYGFTTYNLTGEEKENASLLGMPSENDWILNGLAFDPSLIRDYLGYNLSRQIGQYASRTQYCEVIINGVYHGLYILQEKMKADGDRIDVKKIDTEDNILPKLTGGYITKSDKITSSDPVAWSMPSYTGFNTNFVHSLPKPADVTSEQNEYIQSEFERLRAAAQADNISLTDGYPSVIDIPSFVDFMLINELFANVDAYQFSTYFHKDRNGKLRAGPVWDLNLTLGNDLFMYNFDRSHTDTWQFDNGDNIGATFWRDLFENNEYRCLLSKRWSDLTQPNQPFHLSSFEILIDETVDLIAESISREEQTWGTVSNHAQEVSNMKAWIADRIAWITQEIGHSASCNNVITPPLVISKINYHPPSYSFKGSSDFEFLEILNNGDEPIVLTGFYFGGTGLVYQFPVNSSIDSGQRIILANNTAVFEEAYESTPFGQFSRSLSNCGQTISLLDGFGNEIDKVIYGDDTPWPVEADGGGSYLEVTDHDADNNDPTNWSAVPIDFKGEVVTAIDLEEENTITIYPNPIRRGNNIILSGNTTSSINEWIIYDINGRSYSVEGQRVNEEIHLDVSVLSDGLYFLTLRSSKKTDSLRLLIY